MIVTESKTERQNSEQAADGMAAAVPRHADHEEYICSVCREFFERPVRTSCNHLFCEDCLKGALSAKQACPFCRNSITSNEFLVATDVIRKMQSKFLDCSRCRNKFKPIDGRQHDDECVTMAPAAAVNHGGLGITVNRHVFPCAYCGAKNFSRESLLAHCNANHQQAPNHKLVCTICIAFPWGNQGLASGHLLDHLNRRHQFDYDRFVDLNEDEDASLRDTLQGSLYNL